MSAVASNKAGARALVRAEAAGIPNAAFELDDYESREQRDAAMADWLVGHGVTLVVCAGYMHLLRPRFFEVFGLPMTLDGEPVWRRTDAYRTIGLVPERELSFGYLTGRQFVRANADFSGGTFQSAILAFSRARVSSSPKCSACQAGSRATESSRNE